VSVLADPAKLLLELQGLQGGVVDASTLIYLQRLAILPSAASWLRLVLLPQVAEEFGPYPEGMIYWQGAPAGPTDRVVCQAAEILSLPVLSEDGGLLRAARRQRLPHYNILTLLLAFCAQGRLPVEVYPALRDRLLVFARYRPEIATVGDAVFAALVGDGSIRR